VTRSTLTRAVQAYDELRSALAPRALRVVKAAVAKEHPYDRAMREADARQAEYGVPERLRLRTGPAAPDLPEDPTRGINQGSTVYGAMQLRGAFKSVIQQAQKSYREGTANLPPGALPVSKRARAGRTFTDALADLRKRGPA
jgi:hypothetical protein